MRCEHVTSEAKESHFCAKDGKRKGKVRLQIGFNIRPVGRFFAGEGGAIQRRDGLTGARGASL